MSERKRARKARPPGEFVPSQFASCIENGLNVHVRVRGGSVADDADAAAKKSPKDDDDGISTKARRAATAAAAGRTNIADDDDDVATTYPRVECTDGAMEALRLCHSAFLSAISARLGESSDRNYYCDSGDDDDDDYAPAAAVAASSKKRRKAGPSSSSSSAVATAATMTVTEGDVLECMDRMGLSDLARRAVEMLSSGDDDDADSRPQKKKKGKKKKKPFSDFKGTQEELIAEQERLLLESARRMQTIRDVEGKSEE